MFREEELSMNARVRGVSKSGLRLRA
jgi:hypothetical protein